MVSVSPWYVKGSIGPTCRGAGVFKPERLKQASGTMTDNAIRKNRRGRKCGGRIIDCGLRSAECGRLFSVVSYRL